jgi:hypothetical protein
MRAARVVLLARHPPARERLVLRGAPARGRALALRARVAAESRRDGDRVVVGRVRRVARACGRDEHGGRWRRGEDVVGERGEPLGEVLAREWAPAVGVREVKLGLTFVVSVSLGRRKGSKTHLPSATGEIERVRKPVLFHFIVAGDGSVSG